MHGSGGSGRDAVLRGSLSKGHRITGSNSPNVLLRETPAPFDWIEVGRIRRKKLDAPTASLDDRCHAGVLVSLRIVQDDQVTGAQLRCELTAHPRFSRASRRTSARRARPPSGRRFSHSRADAERDRKARNPRAGLGRFVPARSVRSEAVDERPRPRRGRDQDRGGASAVTGGVVRSAPSTGPCSMNPASRLIHTGPGSPSVGRGKSASAKTRAPTRAVLIAVATLSGGNATTEIKSQAPSAALMR
jgi:hypothetical protein